MKRRAPSPMESRVLGILHHAARAGAACPSNSEICDALLLAHPSSATEAIAALQRKGLIVVERGINCRRVTIVADGSSTAFELRRGRALRDSGAADDGYRGPPPEHQRVDRDPCCLCGVRGDIGCHHQRRAA